MGQRPDELRPRELVVRVSPPHDRASETTAQPAEEDPLAAAREDIELTRADMTSTIEAIQDKLDPELLSEQAKDTAHDVTDYAIREAKEAAREITDHALQQAREAVRDVTGQAKQALREATLGKVETMARTANETAGGWRQSLVETVKANPMPAALVGLGVGWMFLNRPSSESSRGYNVGGRPVASVPAAGAGYGGAYGAHLSQAGSYSSPTTGAQATVGRMADRAQDAAGQMVGQVQDTAGQVQDTAGQIVGQAQDTAGQLVGQVQDTAGQVHDTAGQVVGQVQEQASNAQSFLQRQLNENPLLVGAVALAVGGALAGTVRSTPREDQMLGEARDRLMGTAKDFTQDTLDKVGRVVDEAQTAATEAARQQELVPGSSGSSSAS